MRQLNSKEKELNEKAINKHIKDLEIFNLSKDVLESELAILDKRTKISKYNKEQELDQTNQNINYLRNQINILQEQNTKGVKSKNGK